MLSEITFERKIQLKFIELYSFLKEVVLDFINDNVLLLGASLSFYTIFSLPPLLLIMIAVAGFFFGADAVEGRIVQEIQGMVGKDGALAIQTILKNAHKPGTGTFASTFGVIMLLVGATGVFAQLQYSLNTVWNVKIRSDVSWLTLIKDRVLSFGMVLGLGFMLLVSLIMSTMLTAFDEYLVRLLHDSAYMTITRLLNFGISFSVITISFAMIYKFLPDVKISFKDVSVGAIVTAILFTIGKYLIGLYMGSSDIGTTYGAAGSVIITFVWIFYASLIFFFGAEITEVYAKKYGSNITPQRHAEFIRVEEVKGEVAKDFHKEYEGKIKEELFLIPLYLQKMHHVKLKRKKQVKQINKFSLWLNLFLKMIMRPGKKLN